MDMPANAAKLTSIVEEYLAELRRLCDSGGAAAELSTYTALANLINDVGATLRPKVFCVAGLADSGDEFETALQKPRAFAHKVGAGLGEYLSRALSYRATLNGRAYWRNVPSSVWGYKLGGYQGRVAQVYPIAETTKIGDWRSNGQDNLLEHGASTCRLAVLDRLRR